MPYIKLEDFSGEVPRTGPTRLDANQAQIANNVKLQSRELRSWALPEIVYTPTLPDVNTIYRIDSPVGQKYWLEWETDVDMVPGPVADIDEFRYYYTGDGKPKKTNWALATNNGAGVGPFPDEWLYMGVPNPVGAPTLSASSSSGTVETRAYVYTYVSKFGDVLEESGPSPAATVTVTTSGATVTVSGFSAPPTTGYNIIARRLYRTITGATAVTYSFVTELPLSTTSYVDAKLISELGSEIPSLYWTPPPDDLKGLVALPNGMLAGFIGNQIWLSEPYYPHAWPEQYMLTVDYPVVGLGVYENNLVVCTTKFPYLISGVSPASMSQQKLPIPQPCVAKRSIVSDQYGVLYASPNGLVSLGAGSQDVVTVPLFTRDEWQQIEPTTLRSMVYNNMYMGFYTVEGTTKAIVISRGDIPPLVSLNFPARCVFVDRSTSSIYAVSEVDRALYQLDASTVNTAVYEWKSKKFILPNPTNFGAIKVSADYSYMDSIQAYIEFILSLIAENKLLYIALGGNIGGYINNEPINTLSINGSVLADLPPQGLTRFITLIIYANGEQVAAYDVTNEEPIRLPAMQKDYIYEILISGNTPVRMVAMASSIGELRQIGD